MKRFFGFFLLLFLIINFSLLIFNFPAFGQGRFATCDLCGYCPPNPPPSNWESCRSCLYQSTSSDPGQQETLKIDDANNLPPTPMPGRWYTMIGCINTNLNSFQQQGAAGSVVQILLNLIFASAGAIALVYFIYGSFLILTSQASPERLGQGKRTIYSAIVGLIFSLASVFLVNLIASGVLKIPGFGSVP